MPHRAWRAIDGLGLDNTAAFLPTGGGGVPFPFSTDPNATFSSAAFRISGYAGYNWQVTPVWVVGLEGDFGWAKNHDRLGSRIPGLGLLNAGSFTEVKGSWDASLRARAGYLINPALLAYVTGGAAFQHIQEIATCPADTNVCNPAVGTQSFSIQATGLVGRWAAALKPCSCETGWRASNIAMRISERFHLRQSHPL